MNALLELYDEMGQALVADPLLLLASAVATFDPLWPLSDDEDIDGDAEPLLAGLQVTRRAFPDLYAEAVQELREGRETPKVERLLCAGISAKGIPLDELESIGYGVPLVAFGVSLEDPDFYAAHADLLPILALFGIDGEGADAYRVEVPEPAYAAGRAAAASLLEAADERRRQVGWAMGWLFSCTGNSLVDYTAEDLYDIPPLSWSAEDVAFAVELVKEGDSIMRDVRAGLETLKASPDLMAALERNIVLLLREQKKGGIDERCPRLDWPGALERADGEAKSHA